VLLNIFSVFSITIVLSIFFVLSGSLIYSISISNSNEHPTSFKCGFGYFLGMTFFIVIYKLFSFISNNAKVSLVISLLIIVVIAILWLKKAAIKNLLPFLNYKLVSFLIIIYLVFSILTFSNHLSYIPLTFEVTAFDNFGSLHSGRYANIATYILESNRIPCLSQNYGQSILTSIHLLLGFNNPYLSLYFWLTVSMLGLAITFYGFLRFFAIKQSTATIGAFILLFCSTALSMIPVLVVDSGFPLIFNGCTDTLASIATFLGFVVWLNACRINKYKGLSIFFIPFILGIGWNLYAPQNIIITFPIMMLILFVDLYKKNREYRRFLIVTLIFCVAVLIGMSQGGMLAPKRLREKLDIKGVMSPDNRQKHKLYPVMPYRLRPYDKLGMGPFGWEKDFSESYSSDNLFIKMWQFESFLWDSLRIAFYPILGMILFGFFVILTTYTNCINKDIHLRYNYLLSAKNIYFISILSFVQGYFITFFWVISAFKWELTRFMIPGYCLGMILLIVSVDILLRMFIRKHVFVILTWISLTFFTTIGMTIDSGVSLYRLTKYNIPDMHRLKEKIRMLVQTNGMTK